MEDLGNATEDQVILAWLQAEIESPDFQAFIVGNPPNPANLSLALKAARTPDLRDQTQNDLRRQIITSVYGFGLGVGSFEGLANDVRWRRFRLTTDEVSEMLVDGGRDQHRPVRRKGAEPAGPAACVPHPEECATRRRGLGQRDSAEARHQVKGGVV